MNVLVIEDEPISAKLIRIVLAAEGYTVSAIAAAEQALHAIEHSKPHLIVLDLVLPGVDGLTLARQLKQDLQTQDIFIIAVTAYSDRWSRQAVMDAGCDAYLTKPIGTRMLCEQVATITNRRLG
jgi:CheY-like chemotaxis protein